MEIPSILNYKSNKFSPQCVDPNYVLSTDNSTNAVTVRCSATADEWGYPSYNELQLLHGEEDLSWDWDCIEAEEDMNNENYTDESGSGSIEDYQSMESTTVESTNLTSSTGSSTGFSEYNEDKSGSGSGSGEDYHTLETTTMESTNVTNFDDEDFSGSGSYEYYE